MFLCMERRTKLFDLVFKSVLDVKLEDNWKFDEKDGPTMTNKAKGDFNAGPPIIGESSYSNVSIGFP